MKKKKLIATLCSFVLIVCVCTMCVMAASTATANIVANISYTAKGNVKSTIDLSQGVENETTSEDINQNVVPDNSSTYPESENESENNGDIISTGTSTEQTGESPSIAGATMHALYLSVYGFNPAEKTYYPAWRDYINGIRIYQDKSIDVSQYGTCYTELSRVTLVADVHPYWEFEGWFIDSFTTYKSTNTEYEFNITSDHHIYAKFKPKKYNVTVQHPTGVTGHSFTTQYDGKKTSSVAKTYSVYYTDAVDINYTYNSGSTASSFIISETSGGWTPDLNQFSGSYLSFIMGYNNISIRPNIVTAPSAYCHVSIIPCLYYPDKTGPSAYERTNIVGNITCSNSNSSRPIVSSDMGDYIMYGTNYDSGASLTINCTPNPNYKFVKWCWGTDDRPWIDANDLGSTSSTYTFSKTFEGSGLVVSETGYIFALCSLTTLSVVLYANSGVEMLKINNTNVNVGVTNTYNSGSTLNISATIKNGYRFVKWTDANNDLISTNINFSTTLNDNLIYIAVTEPISYSFEGKTSCTINGINFDENSTNAGYISFDNLNYVSSFDTSVNYGNDLSVYAKANTGYAFLGFNSAKDGTGASYNATESSGVYSYTFSNITSNNTIYAIFAKTYTVNIQIDDGVGNVVGSLNGTFYVGQQLNLNDTSIFDLTIEDGYIFDGWELVSGSLPSGFEVDSIEQSNSLIMPSGDFTVKATTKLANRIVFDGTEIVASGSFDLGNINLSIPEGSQDNVVYWYSLTVTNNYTTDDTFDKTYLKITFNLPTDALGETAVLTVKYLNANGDDNTSAWSTISDGKQHFVLAPTGTAGQDNIATIVVTFEINAESSASANLASSIILEACDENGLTAEELSTNNSAIVSDNSSSSLENNLLDFQDVILNNNSNENLNLIFYLKEIV